MRSSFTRLLAGTAVAAVTTAAVVTAAGTAGATTTAKTHTTLSIVAGKSTITAGQADAVGGTLKAAGKPVVKKVVELYRWDYSHKHWKPVKVQLTGAAGAVKFAVKPGATDKYELVFHGNANLAASHSGVITIVVKPAKPAKTATSLTIAASPTSIQAGAKTDITGTLTAGSTPLVKKIVNLYRWDATAKKWVRVAVQLTGAKGGVDFVREPGTTRSFELVYFGNATYAASHSDTVAVTVTP
jgi:hypothetical protein